MSDETRDRRDRTAADSGIVPDAEPAVSSERDFGKTGRYANQDQGKNFNVRNIGDGTALDLGRGAASTDATRIETETRAADEETPGVKTRPQGPFIEKKE